MVKQSKLTQKFNVFVSRTIIVLTILSCLVLFGLALSKPSRGGHVPLSTSSAQALVVSPAFIEVATTQDLLTLFDKHDYDLDVTKANEIVAKNNIEVPALFLSSLPNDFAQSLTISEKKELFIRTLLPLILDANVKIAQERKELLALRSHLRKTGSLSQTQQTRVETLATKYRMRRFNLGKIDDLVRRIDVIPVAMALGQAIEETGWGRSYAARVKNATHGVTLVSGVKAYGSLAESVNAYMLNLNANPAYIKMRDIRACLRSENKNLCGIKMMDGLYHYSELRYNYIKKVKDHIRRHNLGRFDKSQLKTIAS